MWTIYVQCRQWLEVIKNSKHLMVIVHHMPLTDCNEHISLHYYTRGSISAFIITPVGAYQPSLLHPWEHISLHYYTRGRSQKHAAAQQHTV